MLTKADLAAVTEVAAALVKEAIANTTRGDGGLSLPVPLVRPASVGAGGGAGVSVLVRVDGDFSPITAINALPTAVRAGQRVLVMFLPPHGIYITGSLSGGGGVLGYATKVANQSFTAITDLTDLSVMCTPGAGNLVRVSAQLFFSLNAGSNNIFTVYIYKDGAQIYQANDTIAGAGFWATTPVSVLDALTDNDAHTYKIRASSANSVTCAAAPTYPAHMLVEAVGTA